jgi:hypothetical protein
VNSSKRQPMRKSETEGDRSTFYINSQVKATTGPVRSMTNCPTLLPALSQLTSSGAIVPLPADRLSFPSPGPPPSLHLFLSPTRSIRPRQLCGLRYAHAEHFAEVFCISWRRHWRWALYQGSRLLNGHISPHGSTVCRPPRRVSRLRCVPFSSLHGLIAREQVERTRVAPSAAPGHTSKPPLLPAGTFPPPPSHSAPQT